MRKEPRAMNVTPHLATAELGDAALDGISGGLAVTAAGGVHIQLAQLEICADLDADVSAAGISANVNAHVG